MINYEALKRVLRIEFTRVLSKYDKKLGREIIEQLAEELSGLVLAEMTRSA